MERTLAVVPASINRRRVFFIYSLCPTNAVPDHKFSVPV
jgi:hypothetical protein